MTSSTAKMAHNNSISVDRDALREQQRQARAQMMDINKDPPTNTAGLFAEPIFKVSNATDDPLRRQIQRTLGPFNTFKETFIQSNPKNLIGITSQHQSSSETNQQSTPYYPDALKPPKPPYPNGHLKSSSGGTNSSSGGGQHHHHHNNHHHRGGGLVVGGLPSSNSRSNNVSAGGTNVVPAPRTSSSSSNSNNNGWSNNINSNANSQVKQPTESYSTVKQKGAFKPHSPVPQIQSTGNHSTGATTTLLSSQELTTPTAVQYSPAAGLMDKMKHSAQISQPSTHLHSSSSALSSSTTSGGKTSEHSRANGTLYNGSVKPGYGRSGTVKPALRLNIEEAAVKTNQEQTELENILKEMIAPTPLTAIPTPRKDETKFAFSAVAPTHQLANSPSSDRLSSKTVLRALDKSFAVSSAPFTADVDAKSCLEDLEVSDSDEEVGHSGKKSVSDARKESKLPNNSVPTNAPPPAAQPVITTSDSSSSSSGESSSSEEPSELSEDESKPQSPKQNWNLNNFMPTQAAVPFGLPPEASFLVAESTSTSNRHRRGSNNNSASKLSVCDPSSGSNNNSRRLVGKTKDVSNFENDDDFGLVPDIKTLITSPSRDSRSSYLGGYPRNDEAFSKMIEDVPTVSSPLSPFSPPHSHPAPLSSVSSKSRLSSSHQMKKTSSSVSPRRSRSPAISSASNSSCQSRESKSLVNREQKERLGNRLADEKLTDKDARHKQTASFSKERLPKVKQKKPHKSEPEMTFKGKVGCGIARELEAKDEIASKKSGVVGSKSKRPRTPPGPPPISPPPLHAPSGKSLLRQNSSGSNKGLEPPPVSPSPRSKVSSAPNVSKSSATISSANKVQAKAEQVERKKSKKIPQVRKSKSSNKFQSKEMISDTEDSDSDADIDVGMGGSPPQPPLQPSKSPANSVVGEKNKCLDRISQFSSSTSLSSTSDATDDISTAPDPVVNAKAKSNNTGGPSSSSSMMKKGKVHSQPSSSLKSNTSRHRDSLKSKSSSSSHKGNNPNSVAEDWMQVPAPLSPLRDDFKEDKLQYKVKESTRVATPKFPPITYRDGIPSLMVSLDKNLLDRLPAYPPTQLRLVDNCSSSRKLESVEKKVKADHKRMGSSSPSVKAETKPKQGPNHDGVAGKENSQAGLGAKNKSDGRLLNNKRPLQDPDVRKFDAKKLKPSKEKDASSDSVVQASMKMKLTPNERPFDGVKVKKEELQNEIVTNLKSSSLKNSPANRMPQSPIEHLEKKSKRSSNHQKSPSSKRDKKHSSLTSVSSIVKKEKSSRENEFLAGKSTTEAENDSFRHKKNSYESASGVETKKESSTTVFGDYAATASSSLTASSIPKENKLRGRESSDVSEVKKRKWSGSSGSSTSQATSVPTDTHKAITSEGIERNTNHDRIPSAGDFPLNRGGIPNAASRDLMTVINRINEILDVKRPLTGEYYLNHAKTLKHDADKEPERTIQLAKYLHAALYFILSWMIEEERGVPHCMSMFNNTLDLIKFVSSKFRSSQSTNGNSTLENKVAVLSLWYQAVLYLGQFSMRRKEMEDLKKTLSDYQKTQSRGGSRQMTSPGQSSSNAVPATLWSNKTNGAPSPMSPLPSPAGSVGSVESQSSGYSSSEIGHQHRSGSGGGGSSGFSHGGGGASINSSAALTNPTTVSIPVYVHSSMQKQLVNLNYLNSAFESWEQAESLIVRGGNQDFFTGLDERFGKLTLFSSLTEVMQHVLLGLHLLGIDIFKK